MKRMTFTICAAVFLFTACSDEKKTDESMQANATVSSNDSKPKEEPWVPVDSAAAMKAMMDYATPGEPIKCLPDQTAPGTVQ